MKYKVGDNVKVRSDLVVGGIYNRKAFMTEMKQMCGLIVTIDIVLDGYYKIKEFYYDWTDEMFEGIIPKKWFINIKGRNDSALARLYVDNDPISIKTVDIACCTSDIFSIKTAAKAIIEKLFKTEPKFRKGDIVKISRNYCRIISDPKLIDGEYLYELTDDPSGDRYFTELPEEQLTLVYRDENMMN